MIYVAAIILIFIACGVYINFRGKVRFRAMRQVTDHSVFLAPINCLFYAFSKLPNKPFVDVSNFRELDALRDNWRTIREEAVALNDQSKIVASRDLDDLGFESLFKTGWKRFYLKWYGSTLNSANELCPKTVEILEKIPSVKGGMFTMLPPGTRLGGHRDPYAGSYRYHLGLVTPNSEDCWITVDGDKYWWKDGEAMMFDETYIHAAENNTEDNRIILFLDVKRPVRFFLLDWFNTAFSKLVVSATASKNVPGDKVGLLNRIFPVVYSVGQVGQKVKANNRNLYYTLKYVVLAVIAYFLLVHWWLVGW